MSKRTRIGLIVALGALLALTVQASASAADLVLGSGAYTVDTTALKLTGPGPTEITGVDEGGIAVFRFDNVNIASGATITATGLRPLKIVAAGDLTMAGTINGSGQNSNDCCGDTVGAHPGGPGGGSGGSADAGGSAWSSGSGPGGGGKATASNDGGGGGGFGGNGARGGVNGGGGVGGAAGLAYGNLNLALQGGSGGSGSGFAQGGGGGGAIALFGHTVAITGIVFADGGGGAVGLGASGGGSGGGIIVHGDAVEVTGFLVARGGDGGRGGCCGDGGGGGGGRIAYQYRTLVASGSALVNGGTSGARSTTGCCTGTIGQSLDPIGAPGVVTKAEAARATTGPATAVSSSGATLNGTVNPSANPTDYYFEYGTTGAYGSRIPAGPASVGTDSADHVVSQALTGLSPNTTYHYRLVTVDGIGFTTFGSDIGFTTPAAPAAAAPAPPPAKPSPAKRKKCKKGKKLKHGKCVKKKKHHRHHKSRQAGSRPAS